jgi:hypothetical protein
MVLAENQKRGTQRSREGLVNRKPPNNAMRAIQAMYLSEFTVSWSHFLSRRCCTSVRGRDIPCSRSNCGLHCATAMRCKEDPTQEILHDSDRWPHDASAMSRKDDTFRYSTVAISRDDDATGFSAKAIFYDDDMWRYSAIAMSHDTGFHVPSTPESEK